MVLVSIIIGLGIAEILRGFASQIRNRNSVTAYWVHSVLVTFVFMALLQQWWEIWGLREHSNWTFFGLLMMLSGPTGLFLIAYLLFPQPIKGEDFSEYYFGAMRPVWLIAIVTVTLATLFRPVIFGEPLLVIDHATSLLSFVGFVALWLSKNRVLHALLAPVFLIAIMWDILALSFTIS
jgi:hypothetical protein